MLTLPTLIFLHKYISYKCLKQHFVVNHHIFVYFRMEFNTTKAPWGHAKIANLFLSIY